jgi:isopenicillin N synthase-like dioxygenase
VIDDRPTRAAREIIDAAYSVVPLSEIELNQLSKTLKVGRDFFNLDIKFKNLCAAEDRNSGFRRIGEEYSQSPSRPDLNESYSIWGSAIPSVGRPDAVIAAEMIAWQRILQQLLTKLIPALRNLVVGDNYDEVQAQYIDSSYTQLNFYQSTDVDERELLQDVHEDGHLITLLVTDGPGLEISETADGTLKPISPGLSSLIAMSGSALTAMSGSRISPLYHRVRNHQLLQRFSLMYFVNPDVSQPLYAWTDADGATDLAPIIAAKPGDFGLPPVPK